MNQQATPTDSVAIPDISTAINKLMQNPELLSMVASAIGASPPTKTNNSDNTESDIANENQTSEASSDADTDGNVPEILSRSPSDVMSSVLPLLSRMSSLGFSSKSSGNVKHEQLLCALKPYLSQSRCDAIDYILKISRMSVLLKGFKM